MDETAQYRAIRKQHELLRESIKRIGAAACADTDDPTQSEQLAGLEQETAELHKVLTGHFALEEEGGYLEPVIAKRPGLSDSVDILKEQHAEILSMLGRLERQFKDGTSLQDARASVMEIVGLAARHEAAETDLIQKTLVEDIGAGD